MLALPEICGVLSFCKENLVVKRSIIVAAAPLLLLGASGHALAQAPSSAPAAAQVTGAVARTAPAISYGNRRGATAIGFVGSPLMPGATGQARVEARQGVTRIDARVANLQSPTMFGHEYLTYILWAISPDGRSFNLGEMALARNQQARLEVTTPLQTFALVVTAEPYYAVRLPSDVVVLENVVLDDTIPTQPVRYELIERGGYVPTGFVFDRVLLTTNLPSEFFQARNAVRIAQSAGAEKYAAGSFSTAMRLMSEADDLASQRRVNTRALQTAAREAIQTAEDARALAVRGAEADRLEAERQETARREAEARQRALEEAAERARVETERLERERRDALAAVEAARRAQAELEARQAAERQEQQRLQEATRAEAERNRAAAIALDQQVQQLMREREELRAKLLAQLNAILDTQDTARGLVVNMSDVTFATGQATLQPQAREKLAQISGILLAHPSLRLDIEGHTDSVGSDELNQGLSERRADSVRSYLMQLGVADTRTTANGFGKHRPVAANDTAEGRQRNRRVELVVSGDIIDIDLR